MSSPHVQVWRPAHLPGLELMRGCDVTAAHSQPRHTQAEYEICSLMQGIGELTHGGARHPHGLGCLTVILPDQAHSGRSVSPGGISLRMAALSPASVQALLPQGSQAALPASGVIADSSLARRFLWLHREIGADSLSLLEAETRLLTFWAVLLRRHGSQSLPEPPLGHERRPIAQAREFLEEHYRDPISLHRLAEIAGLSAFHFHRVFRQETGLPPHAFLRQIRLQRAKEMLRRGIPAGTAAAETGFFDQTHVTRHFKRLFGITPGRYAQNRKGVLSSHGEPML